MEEDSKGDVGQESTMVQRAMMYGIEALAFTKVQERIMQVAEMKVLWWSLGQLKNGRVKNEETRERVKVGDIAENMQDNLFRLIRHVVMSMWANRWEECK